MIEYLAAIGFSGYDTKEKVEKITSEVMVEPTYKYISKLNDNNIIVEYIKELDGNIGLLVRGKLVDNTDLVVQTLIPYVNPKYSMPIVEAEVENTNKFLDYYVCCEEEITGSQVDFCLHNVVEYLDIENDDTTYVDSISIAGLSLEGKIILNVQQDEDLEDEELRKEILKKSRLGNEEAKELLQEQSDEMEDTIEERMLTEDLFTILEGFFMPFGDDEGVYSVLGTIKEVTRIKNSVTKEDICKLYLDSIGIELEVCIAEKDLVGIPSVGMRFLGVCWLQGKLIFS